VVECEKAVAGALLTLEEPTKTMLQEAAASGYMEDIPDTAGLKMPRQTPKLQIVTVQEMLDGAFAADGIVVKSAERHKAGNKNRQMDFGDGEH